MPKNTEKTAMKLMVDIKPGFASPAQKKAWRRFWQKLLTGVKVNES